MVEYNYKKDTITEFFFFSEADLKDFHYDTHKFGGLQAYDGYKYPASASAPHESDVTKFVNFNEDGFGLEFNVKKTKEEYYEHIESINSFVEKMSEKRDTLDAISLSR